MPEVWFRFVLAVLATWRVTHLLAEEDGPANLIFRFRRHLGSGFFGKLADCFQCLSLWVAIPMAFFVGRNWLERAIGWLALSGGACLLERAGREHAPPPVIIQNLDDGEKEQEHAMLWTEPRDINR